VNCWTASTTIEFSRHFSRLLDFVENGEEVMIVQRGKTVAQLVRAPSGKKPVLGDLEGTVVFHKGWDRPWTEEKTDAFWEGH